MTNETLRRYAIETRPLGGWRVADVFLAADDAEAARVFEGEVNNDPCNARRLIEDLGRYSIRVVREHVED